MTVKLTVIDQTPIHSDSTASTAASLSLQLAVECESLGFHRYWVAEHHDSPYFAGAAPEILLTRIASATSTMRVGSGGVMLTHYSSYKVAETFALIGGLFPGRIDLGIGRAPGGTHLSAIALAAPGNRPRHDHFPEQAAELCAFLRGSLPVDHPYAELAFLASSSGMPSLWMLGSGGGSSSLAGHLGMGLALAKFIAPSTCTPEIFNCHAKAYKQSGFGSAPPRLLALAVICAPTETEARFIAGTAAYRKIMAGKAAKEPLLCPSDVKRRYEQMNCYERLEFDRTLDSMVIGTPQTCFQEITAIASAYGTEEVGVVTVTYDFQHRRESYALLALAFNAARQ